MAKSFSLRFGGVTAEDVAREAARKNPFWCQAIEKAFVEFATSPDAGGRYGGPVRDGATLVQIWNTFRLLGMEPHCALVRDVPKADIQGISTLTRLRPTELTDLLVSFDQLPRGLNVPVMYFDGSTGHCIRVTGYQRVGGRFVYHDPWPFDSLLCKQNNPAGIDARREGSRWSVSAAELESVLVAAMVLREDWEQAHSGHDTPKGPQTLEEWRKSIVARFFHLVEVDVQRDGTSDIHVFSPAAFRKEILIAVSSDDCGMVTSVVLECDRLWQRANMPLALDLACSLLRYLLPVQEGGAIAEIEPALRTLQDPIRVRSLIDEGPNRSVVNTFLLMYLGAPVPTAIDGFRSVLRAWEVTHGGRPFFRLEIEWK